MREHEVPTHVQAEDRVLLGLTFPQIVAITAVCALSYGAYRYAPVGPSEVRMAIAVLFGLAGIAMVVGKIGGRRLPLVAADLLKYRLGARVYSGPVSQLVRSEPPAPAQPVRSGPGPLSLMAKRIGRGLGGLRRSRKRRKTGERRNGRMRWFGKRRGKDGGNPKGRDHRSETLESSRRKPRGGWLAVVAVVLLTAVATVPHVVLAQSPDDERWRDEIEFEPTEPVEGRRIFVEGLIVSGDRAAVKLRAATDVDIRVRAFGGSEGRSLRFWGSATLTEGERIDYSLPLNGPVPSFTVSWEDTLGQAGALTVEHHAIPYPLPEVEGELCNLRVTSLGWTPGAVSGVVESECVTTIERPVELQTVAGHESVTGTALIDAGVTAITGTLDATTGASSANVAFVPRRRDGLHPLRSHRPGGPRREPEREHRGFPERPHSPADRAHPSPGADGAGHQDRATPPPGRQRLGQRDGDGNLRGRHDGDRHRDGPRLRPQHDHHQGGDGERPSPRAREGRGGGAGTRHRKQG